jgi:predicted flap endonuclease-1-like 5' DNA nuclease
MIAGPTCLTLPGRTIFILLRGIVGDRKQTRRTNKSMNRFTIRTQREEEPMPSNVVDLNFPASARGLAVAAEDAAEAGVRTLPGRRTQSRSDRSMSLHVSKLRGISNQVRNKLKRQGVTYTHQLLEAAGREESRRELAAQSGIDEALLLRLTCRADLARIKGVGAIFADMLELIGVDRVSRLAEHDPARLYARLQELNATERFARRAPTQDEVADWVAQARALPHLVDPAS